MLEFLQLFGTIATICAVVTISIMQNGKLQEIHVLVNSQLSDVTAQLAKALERIAHLEAVIKERENAK